MVESHIEWESKVGVKTGEEHKQGGDEVVNGGGAGVGGDRDADDVDQRHNSSAQILKIVEGGLLRGLNGGVDEINYLQKLPFSSRLGVTFSSIIGSSFFRTNC